MSVVNISRVVLFAVVLLVLRTLASAVIEGLLTNDGTSVHILVKYTIGYIFDGLVVILVFMKLARMQVRLLYVHVFLIVILQELIGAALLYAIGVANPSSPLWLVDWFVLIASVLFGTEAGRRMRVSVDNLN